MLAIFSWAEEAVPLDQPGCVVGFPECEQGLPQLLDGLEGPHPQQVLLQRADEALGAAIAFRGADKSRRAVDAKKGQFLLEVIGHVLAAVVVADGQAAGGILRERPEVAAHALADRLERLKAGRPRGGMNADAGGGSVIDGNK